MSHQLWSTLIKWNITPNEIYFLDCCMSKIKPTSIIDSEIEAVNCKNKKLIDEDYNLTNEGAVVLNEFETFLLKSKRKISDIILGEKYLEKINEYREIWPSKRLPSGELARQSTQELKDKFVWFFKNYPEYNWDLVLDATDYYNAVFKRKNYMYMVTSSYFIKKTNTITKETSSKLADYCQEILDNPKLLDTIV